MARDVDDGPTRQHPLAEALVEYGKLQRTNHALRWFTDQGFRRRIGRQLNRGESLNALRRYLFFGACAGTWGAGWLRVPE